MSSEGATAADSANESRKRKRATRTRQGPKSRTKRQRADDEEIQDSQATQEPITSTPKDAPLERSAETASASRIDPIVIEDDVSEDEDLPVETAPSMDGGSKGIESAGKKKRRSRRRDRRAERRQSGGQASMRPVALKAGWQMSKPTGGKYLTQDPVFSHDGGYIFTAKPHALEVLSVEDSLVEVSIAPAHAASVVAYARSEVDPEMVYLASSDGSVAIYRWREASRVRNIVEGLDNIAGLAIHSANETANEEHLYTVYESADEWHIFDGSTTVYSTKNRLSNLSIFGNYIVATSSSKVVVGLRATNGEHDFTDFQIASAPTCVTARVQHVQPSQKKGKASMQERLTLAVGTTTGQILVHENVSISENTSTTLSDPRVFHWHRESVGALAWSRDGNYLISGGRETVLVLWQMETGKQQFLPHLSAEIERVTVSPKGSEYAIQLADNSVMVLSTSELLPVANFPGLQAISSPNAQELEVDTAKKLAVERQTNASNVTDALTIHPTRPNELLACVAASASSAGTRPRAFLQTFDIAVGRQVSRQALTRNKVTDFSTGPDGNPINEPNVLLMQISSDGEWLATVEEWEPPARDVEFLASNANLNEEQRALRREVYLKFWHWSAPSGQWALNTRIDNPHGDQDGTVRGRVLALVSDPATAGFSTLGQDSAVRVWSPKRAGNLGKTAGAEDRVWRCQHRVEIDRAADLGEQGTERLSMNGSGVLAYSPDGSILAACGGEANSVDNEPIHFVQTDTGKLVQSRSNLYAGKLISMAFLERHLLVLSTSALSVWNVVTESQVQSFSLPNLGILSLESDHYWTPYVLRSLRLAADHEDGTFAISSASNESTSHVVIRRVGQGKIVLTRDFEKSITSLMTVRGRKGYTFVTAGAEVYQLTPPGRQPVESREAPVIEQASVQNTKLERLVPSQDEDMEDAVEAEGPSREALEDDDLVEAGAADKPVVRPEQLARVFEGVSAAGGGAVNVRAMFEAVAGLFGRKVEAGPSREAQATAREVPASA